MNIWFTQTYDHSTKAWVTHAFDPDRDEITHGGSATKPLVSGSAFCGRLFSDKPVMSKTRPSLEVCYYCIKGIDSILRCESRS
jgi:hypothetical protein